MKAYITSIATFLPGRPVTNNELDSFLGKVYKISAKTRRIILSNNGIETRHYALEPESGKATHTNAQLAAEAVRKLDIDPTTIESLCCGTSTPDQFLPGHGSMVHGELSEIGPCEVITTAGVCLTCLSALKYGAMSVASGSTHNAVATGSELASSFLKDSFFQYTASRITKKEIKEDAHPAFSFEADFLRWMLSDGAGAVLVEHTPRQDGLSLRIDWIENTSHADKLEACMYAGCVKNDDGTLNGWREYASSSQLQNNGVLTIKQDARLLNQEIIPVITKESLPIAVRKHKLSPDEIDWFLPHYSSEYFREPLHDGLKQNGFQLEMSKWFTNLKNKGNTGSSSFYIMLEELLSSGRLKKGDRILGMVPESGRFSVGWIHMTVV